MNDRILRQGVFITVFSILVICSVALAGQSGSPQGVERIGPDETRLKTQSGQALLVCAYDDNTCQTKMLEGAILHSEFESRLASLDKTQEIIFYCA
jgi:hypothetical protein